MVDQRIKILRKLSKFTQKQVAKDIGLSERAYQDLEYGTFKPNYENIIKLCRYFNVSADYLLGLSDEPRPLDS